MNERFSLDRATLTKLKVPYKYRNVCFTFVLNCSKLLSVCISKYMLCLYIYITVTN